MRSGTMLALAERDIERHPMRRATILEGTWVVGQGARFG